MSASSIFISMANQALAKLLALDRGLKPKLDALNGRSLKVQLGTLQFAVVLDQGSLQLSEIPTADADATQFDMEVKTQLQSVMQMAIEHMTGQKSTQIGRLHVSGDAEFAKLLQDALRDYKPDLDQPFSDVFGDVLGFQLARGLRSAANFAMKGGKRFAESVRDYALDEAKIVVSRSEIEHYCEQVDELRDRVERLEARARRL
jgi:ubiquinone biosynthesis accessory factor UbiJ